MIRNVVFDFGQVMVHFEPSYMVAQYVSDPEDALLLREVVFDRLYWDRSDEGTIEDEELLAECRKRLPERLHEVAGQIYYNWIYHIPEIEGMRELVHSIKEKYGVRTFLLSNISTYFAAHRDEIPSLAEFEVCIFSAVAGHVKPHADMFEYLCEACGISAEETLFVDDSEKNIKGAEAFGIRGYLFDGNVAALRRYLDECLGGRA
jgi:putative hydrolase of the HAD superfamily